MLFLKAIRGAMFSLWSIERPLWIIVIFNMAFAAIAFLSDSVMLYNYYYRDDIVDFNRMVSRISNTQRHKTPNSFSCQLLSCSSWDDAIVTGKFISEVDFAVTEFVPITETGMQPCIDSFTNTKWETILVPGSGKMFQLYEMSATSWYEDPLSLQFNGSIQSTHTGCNPMFVSSNLDDKSDLVQTSTKTERCKISAIRYRIGVDILNSLLSILFVIVLMRTSVIHDNVDGDTEGGNATILYNRFKGMDVYYLILSLFVVYSLLLITFSYIRPLSTGPNNQLQVFLMINSKILIELKSYLKMMDLSVIVVIMSRISLALGPFFYAIQNFIIILYRFPKNFSIRYIIIFFYSVFILVIKSFIERRIVASYFGSIKSCGLERQVNCMYIQILITQSVALIYYVQAFKTGLLSSTQGDNGNIEGLFKHLSSEHLTKDNENLKKSDTTSTVVPKNSTTSGTYKIKLTGLVGVCSMTTLLIIMSLIGSAYSDQASTFYCQDDHCNFCHIIKGGKQSLIKCNKYLTTDGENIIANDQMFRSVTLLSDQKETGVEMINTDLSLFDPAILAINRTSSMIEISEMGYLTALLSDGEVFPYYSQSNQLLLARHSNGKYRVIQSTCKSIDEVTINPTIIMKYHGVMDQYSLCQDHLYKTIRCKSYRFCRIYIPDNVLENYMLNPTYTLATHRNDSGVFVMALSTQDKPIMYDCIKLRDEKFYDEELNKQVFKTHCLMEDSLNEFHTYQDKKSLYALTPPIHKISSWKLRMLNTPISTNKHLDDSTNMTPLFLEMGDKVFIINDKTIRLIQEVIKGLSVYYEYSLNWGLNLHTMTLYYDSMIDSINIRQLSEDMIVSLIPDNVLRSFKVIDLDLNKRSLKVRPLVMFDDKWIKQQVLTKYSLPNLPDESMNVNNYFVEYKPCLDNITYINGTTRCLVPIRRSYIIIIFSSVLISLMILLLSMISTITIAVKSVICHSGTYDIKVLIGQQVRYLKRIDLLSDKSSLDIIELIRRHYDKILPNNKKISTIDGNPTISAKQNTSLAFDSSESHNDLNFNNYFMMNNNQKRSLIRSIINLTESNYLEKSDDIDIKQFDDELSRSVATIYQKTNPIDYHAIRICLIFPISYFLVIPGNILYGILKMIFTSLLYPFVSFSSRNSIKPMSYEWLCLPISIYAMNRGKRSFITVILRNVTTMMFYLTLSLAILIISYSWIVFVNSTSFLKMFAMAGDLGGGKACISMSLPVIPLIASMLIKKFNFKKTMILSILLLNARSINAVMEQLDVDFYGNKVIKEVSISYDNNIVCEDNTCNRCLLLDDKYTKVYSFECPYNPSNFTVDNKLLSDPTIYDPDSCTRRRSKIFLNESIFREIRLCTDDYEIKGLILTKLNALIRRMDYNKTWKPVIDRIHPNLIELVKQNGHNLKLLNYGTGGLNILATLSYFDIRLRDVQMTTETGVRVAIWINFRRLANIDEGFAEYMHTCFKGTNFNPNTSPNIEQVIYYASKKTGSTIIVYDFSKCFLEMMLFMHNYKGWTLELSMTGYAAYIDTLRGIHQGFTTTNIDHYYGTLAKNLILMAISESIETNYLNRMGVPRLFCDETNCYSPYYGEHVFAVHKKGNIYGSYSCRKTSLFIQPMALHTKADSSIYGFDNYGSYSSPLSEELESMTTLTKNLNSLLYGKQASVIDIKYNHETLVVNAYNHSRTNLIESSEVKVIDMKHFSCQHGQYCISKFYKVDHDQIFLNRLFSFKYQFEGVNTAGTRQNATAIIFKCDLKDHITDVGFGYNMIMKGVQGTTAIWDHSTAFLDQITEISNNNSTGRILKNYNNTIIRVFQKLDIIHKKSGKIFIELQKLKTLPWKDKCGCLLGELCIYRNNVIYMIRHYPKYNNWRETEETHLRPNLNVPHQSNYLSLEDGESQRYSEIITDTGIMYSGMHSNRSFFDDHNLHMRTFAINDPITISNDSNGNVIIKEGHKSPTRDPDVQNVKSSVINKIKSSFNAKVFGFQTPPDLIRLFNDITSINIDKCLNSALTGTRPSARRFHSCMGGLSQIQVDIAICISLITIFIFIMNLIMFFAYILRKYKPTFISKLWINHHTYAILNCLPYSYEDKRAICSLMDPKLCHTTKNIKVELIHDNDSNEEKEQASFDYSRKIMAECICSIIAAIRELHSQTLMLAPSGNKDSSRTALTDVRSSINYQVVKDIINSQCPEVFQSFALKFVKSYPLGSIKNITPDSDLNYLICNELFGQQLWNKNCLKYIVIKLTFLFPALCFPMTLTSMILGFIIMVLSPIWKLLTFKCKVPHICWLDPVSFKDWLSSVTVLFNIHCKHNGTLINRYGDDYVTSLKYNISKIIAIFSINLFLIVLGIYYQQLDNFLEYIDKSEILYKHNITSATSGSVTTASRNMTPLIASVLCSLIIYFNEFNMSHSIHKFIKRYISASNTDSTTMDSFDTNDNRIIRYQKSNICASNKSNENSTMLSPKFHSEFNGNIIPETRKDTFEKKTSSNPTKYKIYSKTLTTIIIILALILSLTVSSVQGKMTTGSVVEMSSNCNDGKCIGNILVSVTLLMSDSGELSWVLREKSNGRSVGELRVTPIDLKSSSKLSYIFSSPEFKYKDHWLVCRSDDPDDSNLPQTCYSYQHGIEDFDCSRSNRANIFGGSHTDYLKYPCFNKWSQSCYWSIDGHMGYTFGAMQNPSGYVYRTFSAGESRFSGKIRILLKTGNKLLIDDELTIDPILDSLNLDDSKGTVRAYVKRVKGSDVSGQRITCLYPSAKDNMIHKCWVGSHDFHNERYLNVEGEALTSDQGHKMWNQHPSDTLSVHGGTDCDTTKYKTKFVRSFSEFDYTNSFSDFGAFTSSTYEVEYPKHAHRIVESSLCSDRSYRNEADCQKIRHGGKELWGTVKTTIPEGPTIHMTDSSGTFIELTLNLRTEYTVGDASYKSMDLTKVSLESIGCYGRESQFLIKLKSTEDVSTIIKIVNNEPNSIDCPELVHVNSGMALINCTVLHGEEIIMGLQNALSQDDEGVVHRTVQAIRKCLTFTMSSRMISMKPSESSLVIDPDATEIIIIIFVSIVVIIIFALMIKFLFPKIVASDFTRSMIRRGKTEQRGIKGWLDRKTDSQIEKFQQKIKSRSERLLNNAANKGEDVSLQISALSQIDSDINRRKSAKKAEVLSDEIIYGFNK